MSSRFPGGRAALALGCAALLLGACEREKREYDRSESKAPSVAVTELFPGPPSPPPSDPRAKDYEQNAYHISQGQRLFRWYNCNGCHANGGGGMGPPLMDDQWRYGGEMEQIYATIAQGRPNGMPAFGNKIPAAQIWEIAAYVRTLSGNAPSGAEWTRRDAMKSISPRNQTTPEKPKLADPAAGQVPQP